MATGVRVGQNVGRLQREAAALSAGTGVALGGLIMCLPALLFWLLPEPVIALYVDSGDPDNARVVALATAFLGFAALYQLADGVQVVASGALRGYKDTAVPMYISMLSYWPVGLGGGLLLAFPFGLGPQGIWLGLVLGLTVAAVLLGLRLHWRTRQPLSRRLLSE